jgi:selenide,water dikinase
LAGHCFNVARASNVAIQINASALPLIGGVIDLIEKGHVTAGAQKNREFMASALVFENIPTVLEHVVLDPQTSGGLAIFSKEPIEGYPEIGVVVDDEPSVNVIS